LLKIAFHACPPADNIHSPSGHTSLSTLVYGALTLVSATAWPGLHRVLVIAGGAGLILAIRGFTSVARRPQRGRSRPGVGHRRRFSGNVQSAISTSPDYEEVAAASRCRRISLSTPRPRVARRTIPSPDYRVPPGPLRLIQIRQVLSARSARIRIGGACLAYDEAEKRLSRLANRARASRSASTQTPATSPKFLLLRA
jgi:hypothetical protein